MRLLWQHIPMFWQVLKYRSFLINKHNEVISEMHIHCPNWGGSNGIARERPEMSHSDHVTLTCGGTIKSEACVALAGAAVAYKALSIQCQVFVCHFDLLLTTAPPNMCVGEPPLLSTPFPT